MTLWHYLGWILMIAAAFGLVRLADRPLRQKNKAWIRLLMIAVKAVLAVVIAYECIAVINRVVWSSGYVFAALYIAVICDLFADVCALVYTLIRRRALPAGRVMTLSLIITVLFSVYGTVNAQIISPKEHIYVSDKLDGEHRFVFLSDLHYGSAQSSETVRKGLAEIGRLDPDFVILGGDITDEHTTKEEMERVYEQIGALGCPVYYIYGNHDRQTDADYVGGMKYTPEELSAAIERNGIVILRDDMAQPSEDLVILGREDVSAGGDRCDADDLPERPDDAYVICIDHSPYQEEDIAETGADLQLSGHVHAGQFFPLRTVYRLGVNNIYGEYQRGGTELYVSPGISGWYYPFRTEAHCNYEVIALRPEK